MGFEVDHNEFFCMFLQQNFLKIGVLCSKPFSSVLDRFRSAPNSEVTVNNIPTLIFKDLQKKKPSGGATGHVRGWGVCRVKNSKLLKNPSNINLKIQNSRFRVISRGNSD
jgi:hypothetical protein